MPSILASVTGPDRPGITAALLRALTDADAEILDMEQVDIRGRLNLGIEFRAPERSGIMKDLLYIGWEYGVTVKFEVLDDESEEEEDGTRHAVSVIGSPLTPDDLRAVTEAIAAAGGNIERIIRLATYPVKAYEFEVFRTGDANLRAAVLQAAAQRPDVDVSVQPLQLERRAKRLVVVDVDSTLIVDEVIDVLADEAGVGEQVAAVTAAAMAGELEFEESLRKRTALLAGAPESILETAWERITPTPGARTFVRTLRRLGYEIAAISGGFDYFTERLADDLGIQHSHANRLEVAGGVLTGNLVGPVLDAEAKAEILTEIAAEADVPLEQVVAIGDGANDLPMLSVAGLGIAFNAKAMVRENADAEVNVPYLDAVLFLLGIRRSEIEEVPGADGPPIP